MPHCKKENGRDAFKSGLGKARGLGSAHDGAHHWMAQRLTAIANLPLIIWFVYSMVHLGTANHVQFTNWLEQPINAILMILLIISVFYHAALGSQVITEDYISCKVLRMAKIIGQKLFFFALAVICIFSVLKVAL